MQNSDSFWSDIKTLEGQLAKSPDSLCFARLAEVYLKVGLVDDALHVARQGVQQHPRYLSGQKALARACHAKGLHVEALGALEVVAEALPEDVPSQKLLGRLLVEAGRQEDAGRAYRTALEFAPDDAECRIELESLERTLMVSSSAGGDDEIIEDLEVLDEIEVVDEEEAEEEQHVEPVISFQEAGETPGPGAGAIHDPLSTGTLAELYVKQGFIHKALEIYRAILADNPGDVNTAKRVAELELQESPVAVAPADEFSFESEVESDVAGEAEPAAVAETPFVSDTGTVVAAEPASVDSFAEPQMESGTGFELDLGQSGDDTAFVESSVAAVPSQGVADNALCKLEGWLENIRRIKSCR